MKSQESINRAVALCRRIRACTKGRKFTTQLMEVPASVTTFLFWEDGKEATALHEIELTPNEAFGPEENLVKFFLQTFPDYNVIISDDYIKTLPSFNVIQKEIDAFQAEISRILVEAESLGISEPFALPLETN